MITVIISYPNRRQQDVTLEGVPRKGEHIRLAKNPDGPLFMVEHILWVEGNGNSHGPKVIVAVREHEEGPQV